MITAYPPFCFILFAFPLKLRFPFYFSIHTRKRTTVAYQFGEKHGKGDKLAIDTFCKSSFPFNLKFFKNLANGAVFLNISGNFF